MISRLTLVGAVTVVLLGVAVAAWVVRDRANLSWVPAMALEPVAPPAVPPAVPPAAPAAGSTTVAADADAPTVARGRRGPTIKVNASGDVTYVARPGDTLSELTFALRGRDSKEHRGAVVAANESLQSDPDRVLTGQTYSVVPFSQSAERIGGGEAPDADAARVAAPSARDVSPKAVPAGGTIDGPTVSGGPNFQYTAQPGDTVRGLASHLLGGDTRANRDGIVARNASLRRDPDHLVAGRSYTIVARNGLSADPDAPQAKAPTTQPDADDVARLSVGRMLGYKAQPGDTLSKLAVALLGSDTPANRELITRSNFSLKENPDRLTTGQTYWIAAPAADAAR